jgi:hypothetical protein
MATPTVYNFPLVAGDTVKVRTTKGMGCDDYAGERGEVVDVLSEGALVFVNLPVDAAFPGGASHVMPFSREQLSFKAGTRNGQPVKVKK